MFKSKLLVYQRVTPVVTMVVSIKKKVMNDLVVTTG